MARSKSRQPRTLIADLLADAAGDALIALSLEGRILTWNQGAAKIFGYSARPRRRRTRIPSITAVAGAS
jgi:PAS domain-containing protein